MRDANPGFEWAQVPRDFFSSRRSASKGTVEAESAGGASGCDQRACSRDQRAGVPLTVFGGSLPDGDDERGFCATRPSARAQPTDWVPPVARHTLAQAQRRAAHAVRRAAVKTVSSSRSVEGPSARGWAAMYERDSNGATGGFCAQVQNTRLDYYACASAGGHQLTAQAIIARRR
eukprot:2901908-Pleurochrysis_carterae.AAC.4